MLAKHLLLSALAAMPLLAQAHGEETSSFEDWQLSGFYSLALTDQDGPLHFYPALSQFNSDYGSRPTYKADSVVGLQLDAPFNSQWSASSQLVLRDQAEYSKGDAIERLFVRYQPSEHLTLRAGRLAMDTFMLSDYRRVSYAYPWVRPPHEFYGYLSVDHFDGADIAYNWHAAGEWQAKLNVGPSRTVLPISTEGQDYRLRTRSQWGGTLQWQREALTLRAGYTTFLFASEPVTSGLLDQALDSVKPFWPQAGEIHNQLQLKDKRLVYKALGAVYDPGSWWLRGEVAALQNQSLWFPEIHSYYLGSGVRLGAWQPYVGYGRAYATKPLLQLSEPTGYPPLLQAGISQTARGIEQAVNAIRVDQHSTTLGLRWDVKPGMALKLQWDKLKSKPNGNGLLGGGNAVESGAIRKNIVSIAVQGVF